MFLYKDFQYLPEVNSNRLEDNKNMLNFKNFKIIIPQKIIIKRILNYILFLSKFVCLKLKLEDKICIEIENFIKILFLKTSLNFEILENKHLDEIVLCCIIFCIQNNRKINVNENKNDIFKQVTNR